MQNAANALGSEKKDKLFNFRPALFAAIFLAYGVVFAYYRIFYGISAWWALLLLPASAGFFLFLPKGELFKRGMTVLFLCVFAAVGFLSFRAQIHAYQGEYVVTGTVENRWVTERDTRVVLRDITIGERAVKGRLNATLPPSFASDLQIGEKICLQGRVSTRQSCFSSLGLRTSNIHKSSYYLAEGEECVVIGRSKSVFLRLRARMEEVLYAGMDETPAALSLALLTGDTSGVEEGLMANMRYGGISHIFAVSGLNIGALFAFCLLLFSKTSLKRLPKPVRFLLVTGILFFYSGVCGFTASVVRAAALCSVGYFARLLGSGYDLLNSLGAAAIFILLLSPCQLFDVGFQLSFLACLGLLLLTKPLMQVFDEVRKCFRKRFPKRYTEEEKELLAEGHTLPVGVGGKIYNGAATLLSVSLAAQIATAPALLFHFKFLSGWSLLLNFIFVPFTDGIFTVLLLLTLLSSALPTAVAPLLLYLPSLLWSAATLVFEATDFSGLALKNVQISLGFCVCYYGTILFLSDKWNLSKRMKRGLVLLFLIGIGLTLYFTNR